MTWARRDFVRCSASYAAHLALMASAPAWLTRPLWAQERYRVVAREPWGRLLSQNVRLLRAHASDTYVPGYGPLAAGADLDRYIALLDDVEAAARRAVDDGVSAEAAGEAYRLPESLGQWTLFNPRYFERAIGAWMKELASV